MSKSSDWLHLVPPEIAADHQLTPRLQGPDQLTVERLLLGDVHDGVAAVHHVVEALRVLHGGAVLHVELDPVLDGGLHLAAVVLGDAHHVGGQVEAMHVHTIPAQYLLWAGD